MHMNIYVGLFENDSYLQGRNKEICLGDRYVAKESLGGGGVSTGFSNIFGGPNVKE